MPNFCYRCGGELAEYVPEGEDRPRQACGQCGYIHYVNPKVHVSVAASHGRKLLWVRRNIEPRRGFWELPGGFMELGETLRGAAAREILEEAGVYIRPDSLQLYLLATLGVMDEVHVLFRASLDTSRLAPGPEVLDAAWFEEREAPWQALAFPQTEKGLRLFYRDLRANSPGLYFAEQSSTEVFLQNLNEELNSVS